MSKMKMTYERITHVFFILLLTVSYYITIFVTAPGVPFNVYGYVRDDLGNVIAGASVTVRSPIDQASTTTNSEGKYAVTLSVNGPGDQIQVTATYGSRSGSASGTVPSGSSSMQIDVTVPRISTSVSCSASPSTVIIGGSVTVSGAVSPAVSGATVTLTYTKPDGSTFTRSVTTSSSGTYSDTYTPDQLGTYSVQASWDGNSDYKGAASGKASFTVTKKPSSISISLSPTSIVAGEKIEISGMISPPIAEASVTISYRPSGGSWSTIATVSTDSSGRYSYSWTGTPPSTGSYEVMASWPGNSEYEGASATASFTVIKPDFQLSLEDSVRLTIGESARNISITLRSLGGFSSTITLSVENVPSGVQATFERGSLSLPSNGQAGTTLRLYASWNANPGSYSMKVKASGGGLTHEAALSINIVLPPPSFGLSLDKDSVALPIIKDYNSTIIVTVSSRTNYSITVSLEVGNLPSGVTFGLKNNELKVNRLSSNSTTLTLAVTEPLPKKGNHSLTVIASCSGVRSNATLSLKLVEKIPSRIIASLNTSSLEYGGTVELRGNVTPEPGRATTIHVYTLFSNNTRVRIGDTNVDEHGRFSYSYSPSEVGTYTILVEWPGTDLYLGSSTSVPISVSRASTSITLFTNATETYVGKTIAISALLTRDGKPVPNVNVTIAVRYEGLTFYYTATTNSTGFYAVPLRLAEGSYEVSAYTLGSKYYAPSNSNTIGLKIVKEPEPMITTSKALFLVAGLVLGTVIGIIMSRTRAKAGVRTPS